MSPEGESEECITAFIDEKPTADEESDDDAYEGSFTFPDDDSDSPGDCDCNTDDSVDPFMDDLGDISSMGSTSTIPERRNQLPVSVEDSEETRTIPSRAELHNSSPDNADTSPSPHIPIAIGRMSEVPFVPCQSPPTKDVGNFLQSPVLPSNTIIGRLSMSLPAQTASLESYRKIVPEARPADESQSTEPMSNACEVTAESDTGTRRSGRKRKAIDVEALSECLCGSVVLEHERSEAAKCSRKGCETVWVSKFTVDLEISD